MWSEGTEGGIGPGAKGGFLLGGGPGKYFGTVCSTGCTLCGKLQCYSVPYKVENVHILCTAYNIECVVYSTECTSIVYSVQYRVHKHSIQCTVQSAQAQYTVYSTEFTSTVYSVQYMVNTHSVE